MRQRLTARTKSSATLGQRLRVEELEPRIMFHGGPDGDIGHAYMDVDRRDERWARGADEPDRDRTRAPALIAGEIEDPSLRGAWGPVLKWPIVAIHATLLPTGKVLGWEGTNSTVLFDPVTETISDAADTNFNYFCSGHTLLPDGRLLAAGGHVRNGEGLPSSATYDPFADAWTRGPDMGRGRWYPTTTALASGDVLVSSGSFDTHFHNASIPEIWQTGSRSWRTLPGADRELPLYPFMHLAPDGRLFNAGPNADSAFLDTTGDGTWVDLATRPAGYRDYGTSVMYDTGRIAVIGGQRDPPVASIEWIDLRADDPEWQAGQPMSFARRHLNATVLPDGTVLVTGGTSSSGFNSVAGAVLDAELWNPATGQWSTMARMTTPRLYHSVALLLPDGRVLAAGGTPAAGDDPAHPDSEIYSPPYLFRGRRPTLTAAPERLQYESSFFIESPDWQSVRDVTLVRLSSVTHSFNQSQLFDRLDFAPADRGLTVSAPSNSNLAPPGHYMLFILNDQGVPSLAKIVQLGGAAVPDPAQVTSAVVDASRKRVIRSFSIQFSRDMDPAGIAALQNYEIRLAGRDGSFGTNDDEVLRLKGIKYRASTRSVTVKPAVKLEFAGAIRLTLVSAVRDGVASLRDLSGNLMDGDSDRRPGGNFQRDFLP